MSKTDSEGLSSSGRRLAPLALTAAVAAAFLLDLGGGDGRPLFPLSAFLLDRFFFLLQPLALAGAMILALCGYGLLLLPARALSFLTRGETALVAFGCGSALLSVFYLICALSGYPSPILLAAGLLLLAVRLRHLRQAGFLVHPPEEKSSGILGAAARILIIAASILLVAGSLTPPLVYDVTEYHLGAFTDYLFATPPGRVIPIPHNFYARFPFPVEALYHLGLHLSPRIDTTPKLLNAAFVAAGAVLVAAALRRTGAAPPWRLLAVVLVLAHPVMLEVSLDAYIDAPVAFVTAAAAYTLWLASGFLSPGNSPGKQAPRPPLLPAGALLFGTALSAKYTVAQLYLLPFLLLVLWPAARSFLPLLRGERSVRRTLLWAFLLFALPLGAWLGKNVLFYGNPLAPFFHWVFDPGHLEAIRRERFYVESHFPQPLWSLDYWQTLPRRFGGFWWMMLAPLAGAPFLAAPLRRRVGIVVLFAGLVYLLWNTVRESQARFLLPCALLLAWAAGEVLSRVPGRLARGAVASVLLISAALNLTFQGMKLSGGGVFAWLADADWKPRDPADGEDQAPPDARQAFYERNLGPLGKLMTKAQQLLSKDAKLLLVYEARPYLFRAWPTVYNTVWDESPLLQAARGARTADELRQRLREKGITHVLVNEEELRRLIEQYARPSQLRQLGLSEKQRPLAFYATPTPEDLYPPFWRSRQWPRTRGAVLAFLREAREKAVAVEEVSRPGLAPLRLWLAKI